MAGINWLDGKVIEGWPAVVQALGILFTTPIGSRVMRRVYGAQPGQLLGQPLTVETVAKFRMAIIAACELWEPRFVIRLALLDPEANSPESLRLGALRGVELWGEYRPRAHLGDPTPEGQERRIFVGFGQSAFGVAG